MGPKVLQKMESFTVEEFQLHFDELIERVENGESFLIKSDYGDAVLVPCDEESCDELDEIIRIHTEHEEGC
jgi:antitoxin (DNA-binding transcriptional repressor) of toxin-antitoxin stability system